MKKIIALMLVLELVFSLAACGNAKEQKNESISPETLISKVTDSTESIAAKESETEEKETVQNIVSEKTVLSDVKDFDDFIKTMDDNGYKPTLKENNDGSVTIKLNTPTIHDEIKPTVPTIDKKPEPEPTPNPEINTDSEPEENEEEDNDETPESTNEQESEEPEAEEKEPQEEIEKKPQYTYTANQRHTKINYTERYLYSLLDSQKKAWYRAIDDAVTNLRARAVINAPLSSDRNYYIYFLYMFDNPEHFYLGNTVTIWNYSGNQGALAFCYSDGEMTCRYGSELKEINDELRERIIAKKAIFENEVEKIISTIPANAPDVWKEMLIYDRILTDSHYNLGAKWDGIANDNWTAYGILVNKYGVCESYSEAFQALCLYVGINCTGVVGTAGGGHK